MVQISSSAEGFALSSTLDSCRYKEASSYNCFVDISVLLFDIVETMLKHMGAPLGWLNHHHRRFEKGFTMVEEEELGIAFCTRAKMRRKKARGSSDNHRRFKLRGFNREEDSLLCVL